MPEHADSRTQAPRFTIVSPVYNVDRYLADFIASIESQDYPLDRVEVVMVDDGSTDSSPRLLADWQARHPGLVTVVTKENGGVSSARNSGVERARGEWITFPDPDDTLAANYLSEVDAFLTEEPDVGMVATRRTIWVEATGGQMDHPLQPHFAAGNKARNLDEHPDFFHGSANTAFFRAEIIGREGLRFDERIRPAFEDGQFCVSYLLRLARPRVGFVSTATYTYRKRSDKSSILDKVRSDPGRYTTILELGYLDVLRQAHERRGTVPPWLQSHILYELSWYLQEDDGIGHGPSAAYGEVADEFHRLMAQIVTYLDPGVTRSFGVRRFDLAWREVLLHSYRADPWHSDYALVGKLDTRQRLIRVSYRYTRTRPEETFFSDGIAVEPTFAKSRSIVHLDHPVMFERIVWLPSGAIRVRLGGSDVDVRLREPERPRHTLPLGLIRETLLPRLVASRRKRARKAARQQPLKFSERLLVAFARSKLVGRYFANAWVLMDRVDAADDSAEILFRHLRTHRRKINAWFVISKGTPDHRRLLADGYKRVIPYGSIRWKLLMLNCRHLVSSFADVPMVQPPALTRLGPPQWRFCFLQHGVTKDDLSRWLNPKDIDLLITNTQAEHESFVADGSPYRVTDREAKLAGMPRFDALLKAGEMVPPERRDLILLAPTWRSWLMVTRPGVDRTTLSADEFSATEFAGKWLGLLGSQQLKRLADKQNLQVALLLHPNLQPLGHQLELPEHVVVLGFEGQDVRATFARARVLVTDYSSMAFDVAYIDRPVVYFQFDRDRVLSGGHVGRRGYFDYERDGYGPVATSLEEVLPAIVETVEFGPSPRPEYLARIQHAFPRRDGGCTERVFRAIRQSTRRVPANSGEAKVQPVESLPWTT